MLKISRASVIREIELLVKNAGWKPGRKEWTALGVRCVLERHAFSAKAYSFDLETLSIATESQARRPWSGLIVTEFWRGAFEDGIHSPKWFKLLNGKPADVMGWIGAHRGRAA